MKVNLYATRDPCEFGKGDQVVLFQRCRQLSRHPKINKITVFVLNGSGTASAEIKELGKVEIVSIKWRALDFFLGFIRLFLMQKKALQSSIYFSRAMIRLIKNSDEINIVQTVRLSYLLRENPTAILEMIDPLSRNVFLRQQFPFIGSAIETVEKKRLREEEESLCLNKTKIWLVSDSDRQTDPFRDNENAQTIPISKKDNIEKKGKPLIIGFHGTMSYKPNNDSARYILKDIAQRLNSLAGKFQILIIGRGIDNELLKCATESEICTTFCFSPKNIADALSGVDIYVAPILSGSGMQNKILEAIQLEIPIITTSQAAEPFKLRNNLDVIIAESPQEFSQAIVYLSKNPTVRKKMVSNALKRIEGLSDNEILKKMEGFFE